MGHGIPWAFCLAAYPRGSEQANGKSHDFDEALVIEPGTNRIWGLRRVESPCVTTIYETINSRTSLHIIKKGISRVRQHFDFAIFRKLHLLYCLFGLVKCLTPISDHHKPPHRKTLTQQAVHTFLRWNAATCPKTKLWPCKLTRTITWAKHIIWNSKKTWPEKSNNMPTRSFPGT